jgi:hypothetical protein
VILAPATVEELAGEFVSAKSRVEAVDLSRLNGVLEHTPEDMTATVQCGMSLAAFQATLVRHGQWVPIDPANPERLTVGEILANDLSGPRRLGYGTVREYVIGMRVVLGSGEIIRNGGKVVKNVAGYDLCRLFIGAKNTLGVNVDATFKLRPLVEREVVLARRCSSLAEARQIANRLSDPVALDLHDIEGSLTLVAAWAGAREDVEQQESFARAAGLTEPGDFSYDAAISRMKKSSVLPSETWQFLESLNGRFVARLGNGVIYHEGAVTEARLPRELMRRVKAAYDPRNILPDYSA